MSRLERLWYRDTVHPLLWLLLPLMLLFSLLATIRRQLFRLGLKSSERLPVPVIVVGNISVGGNGKTPLVIRLAQWLRQQGYHPGVVSRGYGGKSEHYPLTVSIDSDPQQVGDEPVLMRQHLGCPLVVDPDRPRGARHLVSKHKCDVILCDDGLQHYALQRDIEIIVMDGQRRLGNRHLLPMGPLREGPWRLSTVDFVINNGGQVEQGEFTMLLEPGRLVNLKYPSKTCSVNDLNQSVTAVAAIGNPQRFFDLLLRKQVRLKRTLAFPDHHMFEESDLPQETVLMTEKDAVKCRGFARENWWYLPVSAKLSDDFKQKFLTKLNTCNRQAKRKTENKHGV